MSAGISRRERIRIAATERIARGGIDALRLQDVARDAEVTLQLLTYHFPNRAALIAAALEHAAELAPSTNLLRAEESGSALEHLRAALRAEFDASGAVRRLNLVWNEVAALPVTGEGDAPREVLGRVTSSWDDQVMIGVLRCMVEGSMPQHPAPREVASALTSGVEGLSQSWLAGLIDVERARGLLDRLLDSYASEV